MTRAHFVCTLWIGILFAVYGGFAYALVFGDTALQGAIFTAADSSPAQQPIFEIRGLFHTNLSAPPNFGARSTVSDETQSTTRTETLDELRREKLSGTAPSPNSSSTLPYNFISNSDEKQIAKLVSNAASITGIRMPMRSSYGKQRYWKSVTMQVLFIQHAAL